jgi:carboxypeptidase Taq
MADTFAALKAHLSEIETLDGVAATLGWDEQTYMPKKAAGLRGGQMALLSRLTHERVTDPRIGDWLEGLDPSDPLQRACIRNLGRTYRRERRVPAELVDRLARVKSDAFQAWIEAKKNSSWSSFAPVLETLLALSIERAKAIDATRHPYEVVLEQYDPGTSVESLRAMFTRLRNELVPLIGAIAEKPLLRPLDGAFAMDKQWAFNQDVSLALGYDFEGGRIDPAEHPFSTGQGEGDVRITSHLHETDILGGLGSTIHETGHALYEQGLPHRHASTTVREAASFGLHESQSRFWENYVGRSRPFARWLTGAFAKHFPDAKVSADQIFQAQNRVERSLIRVQADEVTYNLHIIVRFELELALFEGTLQVKDVPAAWNERYREYLGVTPPDDARGCLQDVHWSAGLFGYFPSYTLGNLYGASLGKAMETEVPGFWTLVEKGDFAPILAWLRKNIHDQGHLVEAPEIVKAAVGPRDHVADLTDYLWTRMGEAYGVKR